MGGECPYRREAEESSFHFQWTSSLNSQRRHKVLFFPFFPSTSTVTLSFLKHSLPNWSRLLQGLVVCSRKKIWSKLAINLTDSCLGASVFSYDSVISKSWDWLSHYIFIFFSRYKCRTHSDSRYLGQTGVSLALPAHGHAAYRSPARVTLGMRPFTGFWGEATTNSLGQAGCLHACIFSASFLLHGTTSLQ